MDWMTFFSADKLVYSFLAVFTIREAMILMLPDEIAGPGGWLVDTGAEN